MRIRVFKLITVVRVLTPKRLQYVMPLVAMSIRKFKLNTPRHYKALDPDVKYMFKIFFTACQSTA